MFRATNPDAVSETTSRESYPGLHSSQATGDDTLGSSTNRKLSIGVDSTAASSRVSPDGPQGFVETYC
jgi:hypothetical protein